jgi:hypothetical protein
MRLDIGVVQGNAPPPTIYENADGASSRSRHDNAAVELELWASFSAQRRKPDSLPALAIHFFDLPHAGIPRYM